MFGLYRFFLSLIVVAHHLLAIPVIGHYAVHGFFILSGYLMTLIMVKTYGYSVSGIGRFCLNRFLRLYPTYWIVLLLSTIAIFWLGDEYSIKYRESMFIPADFQQWVQNVTLIFWDIFPTSVKPRVSPPTWALTVEIIFYCLIALGLSRSALITRIWFSCSILYMLATHLFGLGYGYRYDSIFAGTLAFSLGAMVFHHEKFLSGYLSRSNKGMLISGLMALLAANSFVSAAFGGDGATNTAATLCFYLNYALNAAIILVLSSMKFSPGLKFLDKQLGDFSYPLYLMHWQVGFVCSMLILGSPISGSTVPGLLNFCVTLIVSLVICHIIIRNIDWPIEKVRGKFKAAKVEVSTAREASGI